jgi:hypothetical protein
MKRPIDIAEPSNEASSCIGLFFGYQLHNVHTLDIQSKHLPTKMNCFVHDSQEDFLYRQRSLRRSSRRWHLQPG